MWGVGFRVLGQKASITPPPPPVTPPPPKEKPPSNLATGLVYVVSTTRAPPPPPPRAPKGPQDSPSSQAPKWCNTKSVHDHLGHVTVYYACLNI